MGQLSISHHSIGLWQNRFQPLPLLPKHDLQHLIYWLFLLLKQFVNGCDLWSNSTFGCDLLNFETVVLLFDRLFPTWQLRHSPPVRNSPQDKNHWIRLKKLVSRQNSYFRANCYFQGKSPPQENAFPYAYEGRRNSGRAEESAKELRAIKIIKSNKLFVSI